MNCPYDTMQVSRAETTRSCTIILQILMIAHIGTGHQAAGQIVHDHLFRYGGRSADYDRYPGIGEELLGTPSHPPGNHQRDSPFGKPTGKQSRLVGW
jgi:hypothetical protein